MRAALAAVFVGVAAGYVMPFAARPSTRLAVTMALPSDAELFASLRQRVSRSEEGMPPPKGPDEVAADTMGPSDVVDYCMKSLLAQAAAAAEGCSTDGCRTVLAFALKVADKMEDFVGQLQPGFFSDPQAFTDYIAAQPRYNTLTRLEEYKCMGTPDFSDMSRRAVQKVLVRRAGSNWEDMMINMQMVEVDGDEPTKKSRRWLITSIYKQNSP